ncbi:ABC transporter permease (plasmid) [Cereibacter azotoformans]|uniref:FtsX-like permease family protein n=1 Tax=Cereibacter azotoformans TaxID=43057 RepID=UPI001EEA307C|nr:ABC transporter permease [Cereibacter azotoformans]ULB12283.1 ABC transporter permease [Cereibacter azotoformans]
MTDLWNALTPDAQDAAIALALIAPGLIAGWTVLRGLAPFPLVRALLLRFRGVNLLFVTLIAVSVGLGVALVAQERGLRQGSARAAEKFDLIVAAPGSELTVMLASVFLRPSDMALLSGAQFAEIAGTEGVAFAAPIAFGDSIDGAPVVGTTAEFVTHLAGPLVEGRLFATASEAVAGAFAPVGPGDAFIPAHGAHEGDDHEEDGADHGDGHHDGFAYVVTGRMAPTGSPWDRAVLVPVEGVWEVHGLANGHPPDETRIGPPFDPSLMPGTPAILVQATDLWGNYALKSRFTRPDMMAFFPGTVLSQMHEVMRDLRTAMSVLATLTQVLVTLSVLTALLILVRLIARSLALLRALGAPARFVLATVWTYTAALVASGAVAGLAIGWGTAGALAAYLTDRTDVLVSARIGWSEIHLTAGFLGLTLVLALLPAWRAVGRSIVPDLRA